MAALQLPQDAEVLISHVLDGSRRGFELTLF